MRFGVFLRYNSIVSCQSIPRFDKRHVSRSHASSQRLAVDLVVQRGGAQPLLGCARGDPYGCAGGESVDIGSRMVSLADDIQWSGKR